MVHPCPKCNRNLRQSGEVTIDDVALPVFQCDECLVNDVIDGEPIETALTFVLGRDGKPFDPASPDGSIKLD